jgi:hypothetical protein
MWQFDAMAKPPGQMMPDIYECAGLGKKESEAIIRDYAAALAAVVPKRFYNLWSRGRSPKISVLKAESFQG